MKKYLSAAILTITSLVALAQAPQQKGINTVNNSMPSRISMNVTVARQTQNTNFGEKVNAGLSAGASAVASGAATITVPAPNQTARERRTYTAGRKY